VGEDNRRQTRATNTPAEGSRVHHLQTRSHDIGYCPLRGNRLPMKGLSLPRQRPWIRRRTPDPLAVKNKRLTVSFRPPDVKKKKKSKEEEARWIRDDRVYVQ